MPTYGIVGNPVAQSLSPVLHGMLYEMTGYDGTYGRFLVERNGLADIIPALRTLGISGVNVTMPYKQDIIPYLDELSEEVREIGAVNTVRVCEDGRAVGYNTDYHGFARSLEAAGISIAGKSFAVCGGGGAGRAARFALKKYGAASVTVVSTRPEDGVSVSYSELDRLPDMDAIINCTPIGMEKYAGESPVKPEVFAKFNAAADMIYNPGETLFLKHARLAGIKTLNGLPMLVYQGIRAFELWTGISPPREAAEKIINRLAGMLSGRVL